MLSRFALIFVVHWPNVHVPDVKFELPSVCLTIEYEKESLTFYIFFTLLFTLSTSIKKTTTCELKISLNMAVKSVGAVFTSPRASSLLQSGCAVASSCFADHAQVNDGCLHLVGKRNSFIYLLACLWMIC